MEVRYYGDKISKRIAKTPEGFLICQDVPISRTGFQSYLASEIMENCPDNHKIIHVYRPAEEVFNEKSLASFEGKPVTNEHPQEDVTPANYHKFCCGHVQNVHAGVGEDAGKVLADLYITDPTLIQLIKDGKREVSCGYYAEEKRDAQGRICQTKIRGNHVAVVNSGRAGKSVCIRDSKPKRKLDFNSHLSDLNSGRHGLLSLGRNWYSRLNSMERESLMGRYYYDDDDELEMLEEDDDLGMDEVDELEEDDYYGDPFGAGIEDDDLEEFSEEELEDGCYGDDDELDEEFEDDDELDEEFEDDDELDEEFEDAYYNDVDWGAIGSAIKSGATKAAGAIKSGATKAGGAIKSGATKAGGAIKSGAKAVKRNANQFMAGVRTSGKNFSPEVMGKLSVGAKAGRAVGKAGSAIKSGAQKAWGGMKAGASKAKELGGKGVEWAKANPGKTAAIAGGAGLGAGVLAGRASKDSWLYGYGYDPYYDSWYDDDEELEGVDDIGVEDDDDLEEFDEEMTVREKADALLRDARITLMEAKRNLRDAVILSDDDNELEEEEIEEDDDGYGDEFADDDEEEAIDESEEIDADKTKALREITEASRGISDPHERKNVQDAIYKALCGRSQMQDVMSITNRARSCRMDSMFGNSRAMSVDGQQAIYDSFNPHKN